MICFHFTIFVVLETTGLPDRANRFLLWFAFILLSLSYWKQPLSRRTRAASCCDLLSFYYLCRTGNNPLLFPDFHLTLWFAFILLSLSYWKQRAYVSTDRTDGCDLLSFYYLCRTGNNSNHNTYICDEVVICFHFTIFVVLETTLKIEYQWKYGLWFAFILLSLSYWKQRRNNGKDNRYVVICFHFTIFVVLETTLQTIYLWFIKLWFAFILLSLSYWKQPRPCCHVAWCVVICFHFTIFVVLETTTIRNNPKKHSCDLLSFYYLCRTGNNAQAPHRRWSIVVICFHFTIFVVLETTRLYRTLD